MNTLAPAIRAISDEPAVAIARTVAAPASRPAETTAAAASAAEPATAAVGPAKPRATRCAARSSRSAWNTTWLALDACSRETARGTLDAQHRPAQSKIILAVLQTRAQRSIHQEGFVGIG
jgi:hypothetical protein